MNGQQPGGHPPQYHHQMLPYGTSLTESRLRIEIDDSRYFNGSYEDRQTIKAVLLQRLSAWAMANGRGMRSG